ncbi:MAG TPA: Gfo/Idh/MocA family oxidoreductase [Chloroflexota bacterium]|nr:Gfo/Idh/MocA family oxidoreductase [Chloroflexota bacterium]
MSRLRVAVIGAGNIAQQHLPVLTNHPECEVSLLCDASPAVLAESAAKFGIAQTVSDIGDVLRRDDVDAVFVMVSVLHMAGVAAACLEAGVPTFMEKPPGICSADTARLAELRARRGGLAMVGFNRRFYSSHLAARERLLASGPIVSVTVDAHEDLARINRQKFPPLVVRRWAYANGIHALDLLRFFGGEVTSVEARRTRYENDFPDSLSAHLAFEGGAHGRAAVDWMAPGRHRFEVRSVGMRATSLAGFGSTEIAARGREVERVDPDEDDRRFKPGFWKQDSAFLAAVRSGRAPDYPAPSLEDALASMRMIDAICGLTPEVGPDEPR